MFDPKFNQFKLVQIRDTRRSLNQTFYAEEKKCDNRCNWVKNAFNIRKTATELFNNEQKALKLCTIQCEPILISNTILQYN